MTLHDGPMPDPDLGDSSVRIITWIAERAEPARSAEVALALGLSADNVRRTMARLVDSRRLVKSGRGLYRTPVPSVPSVLTDDED